MSHPRILIADDEPAITAGLSAILAGLEYEVEIVPDGQQALERLSAERFGLVLADLKMPKLDGLALLEELQQREIPTECIIITGQATVGSAVAGDAERCVRLHREAAQRRQAQPSQGADPQGARQVRRP